MPELYPEDQQKVDEYLSASIHQVKRKPFRPIILLSVTLVVLAGVSFVAYLVASNHGVV